MSDEQQNDMEMGTKPLKEHQWLQQLIGEWRIESEMMMEPNEPKVTITGTASVKDLGGLWAYSEVKETMPNNYSWTTFLALGYDVTFKEYRGSGISSASSHAWEYVGTLSADGKVMTLDCEGPDMVTDGTAHYRDIIELVDTNHRIYKSGMVDKKGEWQEYSKANYYRI